MPVLVCTGSGIGASAARHSDIGDHPEEVGLCNVQLDHPEGVGRSAGSQIRQSDRRLRDESEVGGRRKRTRKLRTLTIF